MAPGPTVLLTDDDSDIRDLLAVALSKSFHVLVAASGVKSLPAATPSPSLFSALILLQNFRTAGVACRAKQDPLERMRSTSKSNGMRGSMSIGVQFCCARFCTLPAEHGRNGMRIERSRIYVAPPDHHMTVGPIGFIGLNRGPKENYTRPAADPQAHVRSSTLVVKTRRMSPSFSRESPAAPRCLGAAGTGRARRQRAPPWASPDTEFGQGLR
jgi:hypothetical protein